MSTKKYKIRPCKIPDVFDDYFRKETMQNEQFLNDVICYRHGISIVFDIPKPHNHLKDYWVLYDSDWYEIKTEQNSLSSRP